MQSGGGDACHNVPLARRAGRVVLLDKEDRRPLAVVEAPILEEPDDSVRKLFFFLLFLAATSRTQKTLHSLLSHRQAQLVIPSPLFAPPRHS